MNNKEKIINLLESGPKTFKSLKEELNFKNYEDSKKLNSLLKELWVEKKIFYKKSNKTYNLKNDEELIGTFRETKHDYAFVETEDISVFIPDKFVLNALNNDTVKIILFPLKGFEQNKRAGKVVRVMQRNGSAIIGRIKIKEDKKYFIPDDLISKHNYLLKDLDKYNDGDILVTKFVDFVGGNVYLKTENIIGNSSNANLDQDIIKYKFNLRSDFEKNVIDESKKIKSINSKDRVDLTKRLIYTIDGIESKDLDDAIDVSLLENGNYKLGVHIADVSHFVKKDSIIDKEAKLRGTSIYLINSVFPMLPQKLSNDLCSLNPDTIKFTLTCDMEISKEGKVLNSKIYESKIFSKYRLTYEEVDKLLLNKLKLIKNNDLTKSLLIAKSLSDVLRKEKLKNGMIDFDISETKLKLNKDGEVMEIQNKKQTISEKVIEDLMVVTNEVVAKTISKNKLPGLFRIHPKPKDDNLLMFILIQKALGYNFNKDVDNITSKDLMNFLEEIKDSFNEDILKRYMIQTMEKAIYNYEDKGHYALGLKNYLHFTSPIRRYPDLIVHRLIKDYFIKNNASENIKNASQRIPYLELLAKDTSEKEKIAILAERKLIDIKKSRFMKNLVNTAQKGRIVSIVKFGFFVDFKNLTQGLVHIENMKDDEYFFDEENFCIVGKKNKKTYKLGDIINVNIILVDTVKGLINLEVS